MENYQIGLASASHRSQTT